MAWRQAPSQLTSAAKRAVAHSTSLERFPCTRVYAQLVHPQLVVLQPASKNYKRKRRGESVCAVAAGAAVEPRGRATRTMSKKFAPWATFHSERSASNELAPLNCEAAGARAAVSERGGAGGRAGELG